MAETKELRKKNSHTDPLKPRRKSTTLDRLFWVSAIFALLAGACAAPLKLAFTVDELQAEIERRNPEIPPDELIVPFKVTDEQITRARRIVSQYVSLQERALALKNAIFDPSEFGLRYVPSRTKTAQETLESKEGNCMSIASVYIGLARAVGIQVHYLDASGRVEEVQRVDELVVRIGHVTAVVKTPGNLIALDFGYQIRYYKKFRIMDDLEAVAHFYNNRGYEMIYEAQVENRRVDWEAASRNFLIATRVMPSFTRGWNNLGVAYARLGRHQEAKRSYKTAIAKTPELVSPYTNLGVLYLMTGELDLAIDSLSVAVRLDPMTPHVHYHLGVAFFRKGRLDDAEKALKRTIELQEGYPNAQVLLDQIYQQKKG